jgi:hypothetical protein
MVGDRDMDPERPASVPARGAWQRVILDREGSLAAREFELRVRLALLAEERRSAREIGLDDPMYIDDLELEVADTRAAHAGAVLLLLASLRAALDGRHQG